MMELVFYIQYCCADTGISKSPKGIRFSLCEAYQQRCLWVLQYYTIHIIGLGR